MQYVVIFRVTEISSSDCLWRYFYVQAYVYQFGTLRPTKGAILFLRYLYYNITLNIPTCFDPQGLIIREPNQSNTA